MRYEIIDGILNTTNGTKIQIIKTAPNLIIPSYNLTYYANKHLRIILPGLEMAHFPYSVTKILTRPRMVIEHQTAHVLFVGVQPLG
jgi:hypothetical protein